MSLIENDSEKKLADFLKNHPPAPAALLNEYASILKKIEYQPALSWKNLFTQLPKRWVFSAVGFAAFALLFFFYQSPSNLNPQDEAIIQQSLNESLSILDDIDIAESLTATPDDEWLLASSEGEEL